MPGNLGTITWTKAKYAEGSTSGWTSSLEIPWIEYSGRFQFYDAEGNSVCDFCDTEGYDPLYVKRIHVHLPDGSAHELQNPINTVAGWESPLNFTGIFKAIDGSRMYFDTSNNTLYLPDGSRYLFSSNQSVSIHGKSGQPATTYIDRNGNTLSYDSTNRRWTDTLNRPLDNPIPNQAPLPGTQPYSLPGIGLPYKLVWAYLADVLRVVTPLGITGDRKCQAQPVQHLSGSLFYTQDYFTYVCAKLAGGAPELFNPVVLKEIELPNNQKYQFKYNVYGEIEQVLLPTGGYERFQYAAFEPLSGSATPYGQSNRGVSHRWISVDGVNEVSHEQYALVTANPYKVRSTAPDLSYSDQVIIKGSTDNYQYPFGFEPLDTGKASEQRSYSAGGQMLRRSLTQWNGTIVTKEVSIILDTGGNALAATTTYQHDADLNVISTSRYDFASIASSTGQTGLIGAIPNGPLVRKEETTFLVNDSSINSTIRQAYRDRNLLGLPTSTRVKNASGTIVAQSEIKYDETAYAPFTYGAVFGWSDPGPTVRGMPTTTRRWLNTTGSWLETHSRYDQCGSPRESTDALGKVSEVTYSPSYHFAYPTTTTSADPDGGGPLTPLVTTTDYDLTSGLATSTTDVNNIVTTNFEYNDTFKRLTRTVRAYNTAVQNQSAISYDDVNRTVTTTSDLHTFNDNVLVSKVLYDGLGRTIESRSYEGGTNYIVTQQQYDTSGRAFKKSNPFRPQSESAVWTTTAFDALGRVISVTTPDSAVVTTSYSGNTVTVTDQAGKKRKSVTDGLGRLKEVYEDPNGLNYLTSYSYDVLDNLTTVTQGTQPARNFVYDSLKRLTFATNPESGTISYQYDANGNLLAKTDARLASAHFSYDALNRVVRRWYNGSSLVTAITHNSPALPSGVAATEEANYFYDSQLLPAGAPTYSRGSAAGRLVAATYGSGSSAGDYFGFDAMGRPVLKIQQVGSINYQVLRDYKPSSGVKEQTYPSGRRVYYGYDDAGRTSSFTGELGDNFNRTYANITKYSTWGGLEREEFGTDIPLYHKQRYTNRGQLWDMRLSTVNDVENWNRGAIVNYYSLSNFTGGGTGTDTNGNLYVQQHWIPHNDQMSPWTMHQQNYDYDSLNRITWVGEYLNAATNTGSQHYQYDRWGNRKINPVSWGIGINNKQFAVNEANNRLEVPGGQSGVMSYDSAGNLIADTYTGAGSRDYDAENKMTKAWGWNNQWQEYTYNSDGHRVRRKVNGVETWQVYGMDGELLAEYAASAAPTSPQKEYGYRNGELLITAAGTQACGVGYSGSKTWTATSPSLGHNTGQQEGSNWAVYVGSHSPQAMVFGPYDSTFGQGQHTAQFWLMVDNNSGTDVVATIDVVTNYGGNTLAQRLIRRNEFVAANQWQVFTLEFNNPCFGLVESRVFWSGSVNMKFSQVLISATNTSALDLEWLVTDHLGTPRMVINKSGSLAGVKRHDYLPFGEELYAGVSSRTVEHGYTGDDVRQKFTSKERDNETGLDYFGARHYASPQGRFTSSDEFFKDSNVGYPQTWNKYAYARNNPLKYIDPTGEKATVKITTDEEKKTGTIVITASIAVWTGEGVSDGERYAAVRKMERGIERAWSGTYEQDGITYTVTTDVSIQTHNNEEAAMNSGAQNVIKLTATDEVPGQGDSNVQGHLRGPDTGKWMVSSVLAGVGEHEFTHLLGVGNKEGPHVSNPEGSQKAFQATAYDFGWAFGGAINSHRESSRPSSYCCPYPGVRITAKTGQPQSGTTVRILEAPRIGWWR